MVNQDLSNIISGVFNIDFINQIIKNATEVVAVALGETIKTLWINYKVYFFGFILLFLIEKYWDNGIGSLLYNIIYFSILGVTIFFLGWRIIFDNYFELIALAAYVVAFELTRYILRKAGIWR